MVHSPIMTHNIDAAELQKFSALKATWWDTTGPLKTLHHINPARLQYIAEKAPLAGKAVLDIGCGGGILTEGLARQGAIVTGVDANGDLIQVAKTHAQEAGLSIHYLTTTAEEMAAQHPAQFDVVTCLELLEHVPDPTSIIKAMATLVKPGGHLFFSTINRHPKAYFYAILAAEYVFKLLPKQTHDYEKFIRPSELAQWIKEAGLMPVETKGLAYNPLTTHARLIDDLSVNYLLYAKTNP